MAFNPSPLYHLVKFVRSHGNACGYGNGRLAIGTSYSKAHVLPSGRVVVTNDVMTDIVKPNIRDVKALLGY
jgi:hypothetical protein